MHIPGITASIVVRVVATAALLVAAPVFAAAQNGYPDRPIKMIVPLPPGASADTLPRIVAEKLSSRWGQPVIIENRPGFATNLGAEIVAAAKPDGYTLLATPPGPLVTAQTMYRHLPFDPTAFVPVTVLCALPNMLVARPNLPIANIAELVAFAKANPDKLTYASAGVGTTPHLAAVALQIAAGIRMVHVPYKGLAPALSDVLAGRVDVMFDNIGNTVQFIKAGKIKGLAVASKERLSVLPDVPALAETYPGFYSATWFAVVAPPKTPAEIADKLSRAIAEILKMPDVAEKFKRLSCTPVGNSPREMQVFLQEEVTRWHKVITTAGIQAK
jgi:tripartite-type tricarboxylate transporter receptor subunit TctC